MFQRIHVIILIRCCQHRLNLRVVLPIWFYFVWIFLSSCGPTLYVKALQPNPPMEEKDGFVLFEVDDSIQFEGIQLGLIKVTGISSVYGNCDYETVLTMAKKGARNLGANALKITKHALPDAKSNCHRIIAIAYRIQNLDLYETEIFWTANRKLRMVDFKGKVEDRPGLAATNSQIKLSTESVGILKGFKIKAESIFSCRRSYYTLPEIDSLILSHEQIHFDLSELYARKLIQAFKENINSYNDYELNYKRLFQKITEELEIVNDKFDSETYEDSTCNEFWSDWVSNELESLKEFQNKEFIIKRFAKKKRKL